MLTSAELFETDTLSGFENATGSRFKDSIIGNAEANKFDGADDDDLLLGYGGADILLGGSGNDKLFGGEGADHLIGGEGLDWAIYNHGPDGQAVMTAYEVDEMVLPIVNGPVTIISLVDPSSNTGMAAGDTYDGIENIIGSPYNDVITGNDEDNIILDVDAWGSGFIDFASNTFYGNGGNDRFAGSANHIDWFYGGSGEDTVDYSLLNTNDSFIFVDLQATTQNAGHARSDRFSSIEDIIGTQGEDTILGDWQNNEFHGGWDDDVLMGRNGTDTLWGDEGIDTAVFRGDVGDYSFRVLHFNADMDNERFLEVTDLTANRDGVDYVIGIEQLEFNGVVHNISEWII